MAAGGPRPQIAPIEAGGVSLVSAERANEIIVVLNALLSAQFNPSQNIGFVTYSPTGFLFDLTAAANRISTLEQVTGVDSNTNSSATANSVQTQINNIQNSLTTITSSLNSLTTAVSSLNTAVYQIVSSLGAATINATCDNAGGIDITLTIPNLP